MHGIFYYCGFILLCEIFITLSGIAAEKTATTLLPVVIENTDYFTLEEIIKKHSTSAGFPIIPDEQNNEEDKLIISAARLLNAPKENVAKL